MLDQYELRTQYIPALLCSLPFILLGMYFITQNGSSFWAIVLAQAAGGIGMAAALYYLAAFTCRHVGKWLEDVTFRNGANFPTTYFLIDGDESISDERKKEIRSKINKDFGIDLSARASNTDASRQRIHEAIGQIRQRFFKKSDIILMRNIQFGFAKNLAGGAIVALLISLITLVWSIAISSQIPMTISVILICWYLVLSVYGLVAMRSNAKRYAHTLFDEFLAS